MVFKTFGIFHMIFLLIFISMVFILVKAKDFFIKHDIQTRIVLLVLGIGLESIFAVGQMIDGIWWSPLPIGLCQIGLYLITFLLIKYNRSVHILSILFTSGAALSFLLPFDINGFSMSAFRPYHFMLVHYSIVFGNTYLGLKHKLYITKNEFKIAFIGMQAIITYLFVINGITGLNTVFLTSGPDGTFIDLIPVGPIRLFVGYSIFTLLFCIPYIVHCVARKKNHVINEL